MTDFLRNGRGPVVAAVAAFAAVGLYFFPAGLTLGLAAILAVPCLTFATECVAAWRGLPLTETTAIAALPRYAVIVPAHNEAAIIETTLEALPVEATLVVADNCTDNTAQLARAAGFNVLERQDPTARGKGFAIEYGLHHLEADDPPEVVVLIDADCHVAPGAIAEIVRQAQATNRPAQALYLLERPASPSPKSAVSALAFTVKNLVRPLGLKVLGFPCLLHGTGMAFPWEVFAKARLVGDCLVEDMQQGIDLAIAGSNPLFCPQARVTGLLPTTDAAAKSQRTRWEHGHLQTILTQTPRLLRAALAQRRLDLLVLALEVSVPPLSLLGLLWMAVLGIAIVGGIQTGFWQPALLVGLQGLLMGVAILSAWARFGREEISLSSLLSLPLYLLWKVPLYLAFIFNPQKKWIRTPRDSKPEGSPREVGAENNVEVI